MVETIWTSNAVGEVIERLVTYYYPMISILLVPYREIYYIDRDLVTVGQAPRYFILRF